jgi:hypothetical protein
MRTIKADHLNIQRKDLKPLEIGDVVRMQPIQRGQKEWREATVTERVKNRSYTVETSTGRSYRRNRQFLRHSAKSRDDKDLHSKSVVPDAKPITPAHITGVAVIPIESSIPCTSPVKATNDGPKQMYIQPDLAELLNQLKDLIYKLEVLHFMI